MAAARASGFCCPLMTISTLIIDDEASARSRLRKALALFPDVEIAGEARDGVEALDLILDLKPDLVLLDVQMPGLDGFEVLRALPKTTKWPLVIFATAFDQYALKAFDANAIGYLLKPVAQEKLAQAIERVSKLLASPKDAAAESKRLRSLAEAAPGQLTSLIGRHRDRRVLLALEDICFFRVEDELVKVKTGKQLYWTDYTLGSLENRLPNPPFLRVHRNAVVNLRQIAEIAPSRGGFVLTMKDAEQSQIQVSERQSKSVRSLIRF